MKKHDIAELNKLFQDGEQADHKIFAEMRNNIQLVNSEHWKKVQDRLHRQLQTSTLPDGMKLKLTKNHIQVVIKTYCNGALSEAPGVTVVPYNENELADQKEAELSNSVFRDAEEKQDLDEKIERWIESFFISGECASKVYWDPNAGKFLGYKQAVDEEGRPLFESPMGVTPEAQDMFGNAHQPKASDEPVFSGELKIEVLHPFNIIRKAGAQSMKDSPFLAIRTMMPIEDAKNLLNGIQDEKEREEKDKYIVEGGQTTFKIFDASSGDYTDGKDQVQIREFYFRPCTEYPQGYFYITTESGILFEGELPFGIFPIEIEGCDYMPTCPRARSIIKPLRGPQAEINRMASMRAETQITLGKTMVITQVGSKLAKGNNFAGVREFSVNGPPPTVIPGQSGDQFAASLMSEVQELYKLANLEYEMAESSVQDAYQQLYKSLQKRKKYSIYVRKIERFLCKTAKLYLMLAKRYLPDDYVVRAIGKREAVNLAEFRNIDDDGFNIKLKPMSNDIESMMGKQLNINTILQYAGKDLSAGTRAKVLKGMPFLNDDYMFGDELLDVENIDSDILALDRGEYRPAAPTDNHELYIKRLQSRKKQNDFKLLPPQVQQMYDRKISEHEQAQAMQLQQLKELEAGYWPSGGPLVKIDQYDPKTGKRMLVPQEALMKLVQILEQQGTQQDALQQLDAQNQVQIMQAAEAMSQQQQMQPPMPQAPGGMPIT